MLAEILPDMPRLTLATSPSVRDARAAVTLINVDEDRIRSVIAAHGSLLRDLPDYTQRILAVCETILCEEARAFGFLVTGHGPEAILGGFRRRGLPAVDEIDGRLALNRTRLEKVSAAAGCPIHLPFYNDAVIEQLFELRRAGFVKTSENKSAFQNGSGIHYLFERMAKSAGFRYTREYMTSLL